MEGDTGGEPGGALDPSMPYDDGTLNGSSLYDYDDYIECMMKASRAMEGGVSHFLELYIVPVLLFTGLLCNPITACALYYIGIHKWSTVFYLSLLTLVDLVILLVKAGDSWYRKLTKVSISAKIMNSSDAMCKTYNFLYVFMTHLSPWLVVAVSIELMISTTWPRKTYVVCSMERTRNVILLLVILIFCLDINYFWTWGVPGPGVGCVYTEEFSVEFRDNIWPMLTNTVEILLPLIFVSVCFFVTAASMINRKSRDERSIEEELTKYFLELKTIKDFQVICLIICLVFMCLTLFRIVLLAVAFMAVKGHIVLDCEGEIQFQVSMKLMMTLQMVLTFVFYTMKVVPCFVYSSTFRQTLKDGFLWCRRTSLRLARKISGRGGFRSRSVMRNSKNGSMLGGGGGGSVTGGGGGGGVCSGGGVGDDVDGGCSQPLKPLVNSGGHYNNHSNSMSQGLGYPVDVLEEEDDDGGGGGGRNGSSGSATSGCGGNSLSVIASVENHSKEESNTSFLGKDTDV